MTLKTVNVIGQLYNPDGTTAENLRGKATLSHYEIDDGIVVPSSVDIVPLADGRFAVPLWPNSRGQHSSKYDVKIYTDTIIFKASIVVPDVDYDLDIEAIIDQAPYPPVDASEEALRQVQAATAIVIAAKNETVDNADLAEQSASDAAQSATDADQSARTADTKAQEASASAQSALESKEAAKLSEDNAFQSREDADAARDKARQWAANPVDSAVEPGQYSALHYATKAGESASAASTSAQEASDSEDAAKISEENALLSANQFAENFAQMATAIINTQTIVVEHHGFGD